MKNYFEYFLNLQTSLRNSLNIYLYLLISCTPSPSYFSYYFLLLTSKRIEVDRFTIAHRSTYGGLVDHNVRVISASRCSSIRIYKIQNKKKYDDPLFKRHSCFLLHASPLHLNIMGRAMIF